MADGSISDDDSDEEFLAVGEKSRGNNLDREALVRKKLLESFYGRSVVAPASSKHNEGDHDDNDEDEDEDEVDRGKSPDKLSSGLNESENLDSPSFDASAHTRRHVLESSVHTLLLAEENLALQVRTLDSTMQTLVYENYSRFIDATDAIRSIGVNVQANEVGLARLTRGMEAIDQQSRSIDDALGTLRDQVAEKIRVKRLLTRLDSLLKLPKTLRAQIAAGKHRSATRSYLAASSILSKHSKGFESLKAIETECNSILLGMREDLKRKLLYWSGRVTAFDTAMTEGGPSDAEVPDPPKDMQVIFESAETLLMLLENDKQGRTEGFNDTEELTTEDLQSMTSSSCLRFLDRVLDGHLVEVQERHFEADSSARDAKLLAASSSSIDQSQSSLTSVPVTATTLIPQDFLRTLLEGATLHGMTFGNDAVAKTYRMEFVTESLSSFFAHTKSVLLEESTQIGREETNDEAREGGDTGFQAISTALSTLMLSIRELATALAAPEIGISDEYGSKLVSQATELIESLVHRRVDQKFFDLRGNVAQSCLLPFATRAAAERLRSIADGNDALPHIVQIANSTLSDCLQLVDDTIRSVVSSGLAYGDENSDLPDFKEAVQRSTVSFAYWLAGAIEVLAGGDPSDRKLLAEATLESRSNFHEREVEKVDAEGIQVTASGSDDQIDLPVKDNELVDTLGAAIRELTSGDESGTVHTDFILATAEMCRLAEGCVADSIEQSIVLHLGGNTAKRKSRALFPTNDSSRKAAGHGEDGITARFALARSRLIVLYASSRGSDVAALLCSRLWYESLDTNEPTQPHATALEALALVKKTSLEIAAIFGGHKRGGPLPEVDLYVSNLTSSPLNLKKSGVQWDVERMFKEKPIIFPDAFQTIDVSRDAVVFLLFKIAFRAMAEHTRLSCLSQNSYSQLLIDAEFLRQMTFHYINKDYRPSGTNACTALSNILDDVVDIADERSEATIDRDYIKGSAPNLIRSFVNLLRDDADAGASFVITDD